jgi:hypothetical protein
MHIIWKGIDPWFGHFYTNLKPPDAYGGLILQSTARLENQDITCSLNELESLYKLNQAKSLLDLLIYVQRCFNCSDCHRSLDSTNLCDAPNGEIYW